MHGGNHCKPWNCPECGRFMSDSWVEAGGGQNGWNEYYGGICSEHGEWSDSAA
jgi:hypothetical protein